MRLCACTLIAFTLAASLLEAQTGPRVRAFLNQVLSSPEEYAQIIEKCDSRELNLSCESLVESFNRAFNDIDDVAGHDELAAYIRTLIVKPCPTMNTRIARVVGGRVDLEYKRGMRVGEQCLYDNSAARFISSMSCGQWIPDKLPIFTAQVENQAPRDTPIRDSVEQAARNLIPDQSGERTKTRSATRQKRDRRGSWLGRNWPWFVPLVGGAVVAAACTIPEPRCFKVTQEVTVIQ